MNKPTIREINATKIEVLKIVPRKKPTRLRAVTAPNNKGVQTNTTSKHTILNLLTVTLSVFLVLIKLELNGSSCRGI